MIFNTDARSWNGFWYLPEDTQRHPGTLTYNPIDGFELRIFSEGFESLYVEVDAPTKIFQPPSKGGVYGLREVRTYPAIYGETEGKRVTLLDVTPSNQSVQWGPYFGSYAVYDLELLVVGTHLPSKRSELFSSFTVQIDYLHYWLADLGWMEVGHRSAKNDESMAEHWVLAQNPQEAKREPIELHDGTQVAIKFFGSPPSLSWSAFEYEGSSRISTGLEFSNRDHRYSLDKFLTSVYSLETLLTICLDRRCEINGLEGEVKNGDETRTVNILFPRRGPIPNSEPSRQHLGALARCNHDRDFDLFLKVWFDLYDTNPSISILNGFAAGGTTQLLEPSILMAQTLVETFHKSAYGSDLSSVLPATESYCNEVRPLNKWAKRPTVFWRAIDLLLRIPNEVGEKLAPNKEKWAGSLVDARNGISHDLGRPEGDPLEAHASALVAVAVVTVHVIQRFGITDSELLEACNQKTSLRRAAYLASEYLS